MKLLLIQSGVGDEQHAPVDAFGLLEYLPDVFLGDARKVAHFHAAHHHLALSQHKNRVEQQRVAQNLYPSWYPPGLAHHMGAVDDKSR